MFERIHQTTEVTACTDAGLFCLFEYSGHAVRFGAKKETTLRVSSSLAWLLGESAQDRRKKQANYKKIYGLRSALVHGAVDIDASKVQAMSIEAIDISIAALRAVFGVRNDLLKIKSSEERSLAIMHGG